MATFTYVVKSKGANAVGGVVALIPKGTETKLTTAPWLLVIADQETYDAMPAVDADFVVTLPA